MNNAVIMNYSFADYQKKVQLHVESLIHDFLQKEPSSTLKSAIGYSLLNGGKRIRPLLVYSIADLFTLPWQYFDSIALSIEFIHTYSLIHDDLPAMDNDDFRRGLLTCHKQFNEAQAILAGDALQSEAFRLLADDVHLSMKQRLTLIQILSHSIGMRGLCLGQSKDLESEQKVISLEELMQIHQNKTGALLEAAMCMSLALIDNLEDSKQVILKRYAQIIGLAFQIQDDILDVIGELAITGKKQGSDLTLNKNTYPSLLTLNGAQTKLAELKIEATEQLTKLQMPAQQLQQLLDFIVNRDH